MGSKIEQNIKYRVSAMSGKSGKCQGNPFPPKDVRELSYQSIEL